MDDIYQDIEQTAILLRTIIFDTPKAYENNKILIDLCEKEIIDLEHVIELTAFNASRGYHLAKEIKDVRIRRRELKDQNELLNPLIEIISRMKSFQNDLNKAVGDIGVSNKNTSVGAIKCAYVRTYRKRCMYEIHKR